MKQDEILRMMTEGIHLLKRMGENIDDSNFYLFSENRKLPVIIDEGLIKSYDIDKVVSFIKKCFNLNGNDDKTQLAGLFKKYGKDIDVGYNGKIRKVSNDSVEVVLSNDKSYLKDKLDYYFKKYGYINSRTDNEPDDTTRYVYEKKYGEEIKLFQLINDCEYLYHVTSRSNIENIQKKGIKAKSATNPYGYMHDERVYLFLDYPTDEDEIFLFGQDEPVIFKVILNKLPLNYTFYYDPRMDNALYTYEQIPPEAIEVIKNDL